MPQAVSPRYLTVSPFGVTPELPKERRPQAPKLRTRVNPREWDPERMARYYQKHGSPSKSPIMAKIVLEKKLDGHALIDTPEDILCHLVEEDPELQEEMRATASELRAKAGQFSPSSRLPRVQDIALALAQQCETSVPSLSASPEVTVEDHPYSPISPCTPPEWDLDDDSEPEQQHAEGTMPSWLQFTSPSSVPQLLRPLIAVSPPSAAFELSALEGLDPQQATNFACADPTEDAEHDADAVDSGDHHDLPQPHGDLPSRQDVLPEDRRLEGDTTPHVEPDGHVRSRVFQLSSARRAERARSCPPNNRLSVYIPPLSAPAPSTSDAKTYSTISVQASEYLEDDWRVEPSNVDSAHCDVDIQTDVMVIPDFQEELEGSFIDDEQQSSSDEPDNLVDLSTPIEPTELVADNLTSTLSAAADLAQSPDPLSTGPSPSDVDDPSSAPISSTDAHEEPTSLVPGALDAHTFDPEPRGGEGTSETQILDEKADVNHDLLPPTPSKDDQEPSPQGGSRGTSEPDAEGDELPASRPLAIVESGDVQTAEASSDESQSAQTAPTSSDPALSNVTMAVPPNETDIEDALGDALDDNIPLGRLMSSRQAVADVHSAPVDLASPPEQDIEGGFTVVDAPRPDSEVDAPQGTRQVKAARRESSESWQSLDGADGEDAEAAWELSDRAEKGFVAHGGEDPEKMALFAPAETIPAYKVTEALQLMMPRPERGLSRQISRSSQVAREETRSAWGMFSKIGSAIGFSPSPSSPVPPTPGEDTDSEALFVELTEAEVANLPKAEREKYKRKVKKRRQQQARKDSSVRVDDMYS